ncbi:MAG: hypothetical protein ABIV07_00355 [Polaromonas sp.]
MSQFQQLVRNHYFTGRLLSADDLQREQDYTLARLRRRNRFLTGWGVVSGLGVCVEQGETVVVQPGFAIDCAGNELIVDAPARLSLAGLSGRQHVVISYGEINEAPVVSSTGSQEFSRVRESSTIGLSHLNPAAGHRAMGCGTPGCGHAHALGIAVLTRKDLRWRLASSQRPIKSAKR